MKLLVLIIILQVVIFTSIKTPNKLIKYFVDREWRNKKYSLPLSIIVSAVAAVGFQSYVVLALSEIFNISYEPNTLTMIFEIYIATCFLSQGVHAIISTIQMVVKSIQQSQEILKPFIKIEPPEQYEPVKKVDDVSHP